MALPDAGDLDPGPGRVHRRAPRADGPQLLGTLDLTEREQQPRRHTAECVRLGRVSRDGLGHLDQLESVVDGAGAQELERHAAGVEYRRVAPAATAQSGQLRFEQYEADDVLEVVIEHLGEDVG